MIAKTQAPAAAKPRTRTKAAASSVRKHLSPAAGEAAAKRLGVHFTSPDRIAYPEQGVTKGELAAYYEAVAERMLPFIADRPLSLVRCPQGRAKYCFFQKHDTGGFPDAFKSVAIHEKDGKEEDYFYIDDVAGLIGGVQMNVLEFHIWGSRRDDIEKPERIIFDLDPDEGLGFDAVRAAAADVRDMLARIGLKTFPLLSGGKGIHVVAPLQPAADWETTKAFCRDIALKLESERPERFVANMAKAKRKGKLFVDYLRNERGSTAIAPFSTRSRENCPVAMPIAWDELETVKAANAFSLAEGAARAQGPDPWKGYFDVRQSLTADLLGAVSGA